MAQSVVLEAEHGDRPRSCAAGSSSGSASRPSAIPFTSIAIVPVQGLECPSAVELGARRPAADAHRAVAASRRARRRCRRGFAARVRRPARLRGAEARRPRRPPGDARGGAAADRSAAVGGRSSICRSPSRSRSGCARRPAFGWASVRRMAVRRSARCVTPRGRLLEPRAADGRSHAARFGEGWVAFLDVRHWETGATNYATVAIRLNVREIYDRITALSIGARDRPGAAARSSPSSACCS